MFAAMGLQRLRLRLDQGMPEWGIRSQNGTAIAVSGAATM
jgi:hypothetical protein